MLNTPFKPKMGIYPGSGVAQGGQQGRPATVHNGMGGAIGGGYAKVGATPATPAAHPTSALPRPAAPAPAATPGGTHLNVRVSDGHGGWNVVTMLKANMSPAQLHAALGSDLNRPPAAPVAHPPAAGPAGTTSAATAASTPLDFHDAQYWQEFDSANRSYHDQVDPLNAQLAALQDTSQYGGKTLYDHMYEHAQSKWQDQVRSARDQQGKVNLFRSGAGQKQLLGLDEDLRNQQVDLSNNYGANKINSLQSQLAQYQAQFNDPTSGSLSALARAAQARAREQAQSRFQSTYGMSIDPSQFTFSG